MCGIWGLLTTSDFLYDEIYKRFMTIKHRGPDHSTLQFQTFLNYKIFIGFHRLSIMDVSILGNQPFVWTSEDGNRQIISTINGEIYNYKDLVNKYNLKDFLKSTSDCEIIQHIYKINGIDGLCADLIGEYAIAIYDIDYFKGTLSCYLVRDCFGIRPLFYGKDRGGSIGFSSEMKGLVNIVEHETVKHVNPGTYIHFDLTGQTEHEYQFYDKAYKVGDQNGDLKGIRRELKLSIKRMIDSDRPIGALLSGGLDSSLVVSIISKILRKEGKKLRTFSVGLPGSTDRKYAEMVSEFCDTIHTHVELEKEEFLRVVPEVVKVTETYDITTIRASVGQYLISRWISENTEIKVLFIGDGSDELTCGYLYFHKTPNALDGHNDAGRLLREIHYFDVLRADRGIAANGLEARVPFLSKQFVDYYMNIRPELRIPQGIEKWLLRKAFADGKNKYLPDEVLWRKKEAFSDGVSSHEKSWYQILQESTVNLSLDDIIKIIPSEYIKNDTDIVNRIDEIKGHIYNYLPPMTNESLYYRILFEVLYMGMERILPHYWMPSWVETNEPSARTLDVYLE